MLLSRQCWPQYLGIGDREFLVGGTGHYLNSSAELAGGVLELLREYPPELLDASPALSRRAAKPGQPIDAMRRAVPASAFPYDRAP
jgi:hypothetical protein